LSKRSPDFPKRPRDVPAWAVRRVLRSPVLALFLGLCAVGFVVGRRTMPRPAPLPFDELFENLSVYSYRDAPTDTASHFVVDLMAGGRPFRQYDVDTRRFSAPAKTRHFNRQVSGYHYRPIELRGHTARGFWLALPDTTGTSIDSGEFEELYKKTLSYVRPVSIISNVLGMLSGYSLGYRIATWDASLSNPATQDRILASPDIRRAIAREAWRRVLIEPAFMGDESDPHTFAALHETQRIYTGVFKLALRDSDDFLPREAVRMAAAGLPGEARALLAFAGAVSHAAADRELTSADFQAVEDWASLLDGKGHWAAAVAPKQGQERIEYLGTLAYYGIAPSEPNERRLWVGPRVLVREGDVEGFVTDDLASNALACPATWSARAFADSSSPGMSNWTAQWAGSRPELAPLFSMGRQLVRQFRPNR
jgi:hypothetical protein